MCPVVKGAMMEVHMVEPFPTPKRVRIRGLEGGSPAILSFNFVMVLHPTKSFYGPGCNSR